MKSQTACLQEVNPALAGRPKTGIPVNSLDREALIKWGKWAARREKNGNQERVCYKAAKDAKTPAVRALALKAAAALHWCGKRHIVEKVGENFLPVGAYNCGKKYCSHCSNRKRKKILTRFADFFESEKGRGMLENYDLALFTVTLQHSKSGKRSTPYYKELSQHFRNALKYGSFRKFIAGGFYNTEHTYTRNGHHIHRHALVLIPASYNVRENFECIENELRTQWKQRTGGSFQIDLRPLGYDDKTESVPTRAELQKNLKGHLLEVTKYITKRDKSTGAIPFEIIKAVEENNRAKFYGRFGNLHRIPELKMNLDAEEFEVEEPKKIRELYVGTPVVKMKKVHRTVNHYKVKKRKTTGNHSAADDRTGKRPEFQYKPDGVPNITVTKEKTATARAWEKIPVFYTFKDLTPIEDTREAIGRWKEIYRYSVFEWRQTKWNNLCAGYDVKQWQHNRGALERIRESAENWIRPIVSDNYKEVPF